MKAFATLFVFLLLFISQKALSDVGNCVRYDVELSLESKEKLEGFFQIRSYNPMVENDSEKLLTLLSDGPWDEIVLFKNIYTLEYPQFGPSPNGFKYSAAIAEETRAIAINAINELALREISFCEHGEFPKRSGKDAFLVQYNASVIAGFKKWEIQNLQSKPVASVACEDPVAEENYQSIYLLSYNEEVDQERLNAFCAELSLDKDPAITSQEYYEKELVHYAEKKEVFRKRRVITLKIQWDR